jgi:hypothetical protein
VLQRSGMPLAIFPGEVPPPVLVSMVLVPIRSKMRVDSQCNRCTGRLPFTFTLSVFLLIADEVIFRCLKLVSGWLKFKVFGGCSADPVLEGQIPHSMATLPGHAPLLLAALIGAAVAATAILLCSRSTERQAAKEALSIHRNHDPPPPPHHIL